MTLRNAPPEYGEATRAIHEGYDPADHRGSLTPPVFMTSTYAFSQVEDAAAIFAGEATGMVYGRAKNPTQELLETRIASLERADAALVVSSGMAAITAASWTLLESGDTVVADKVLYGCSFAFFSRGISKFGVKVKFIDMTDLPAVKQAMKLNPKLIFFETPTNPNMRLIDIAQVSAMAHKAGALVMVDNTFATPILQQPLCLGADLVVHSATKFLGGHGDLLAGALAGDQELVDQIRGHGLRILTGSTVSPFSAFLVLRGLKTLKLRIEAHCRNARTIAEHLQRSGQVTSVIYPGLERFPQRDLVEKQMNGQGGAIVGVRLAGGAEAGRRFINKLQLIKCAVSLGDAETLIQHPASMTHSTYSPEEQEMFGIEEDLIRISAGLEDEQDLLYDFDQALSGQ